MKIYPSKAPTIFRRHLTANLIVLLFVFCTMLRVLWIHLPVMTAQSFTMPEGMLLTDNEGHEVYRFHREDDRIDVPLADFPQSLQSAVIAIEDERFYARSCIDVRALLRAAVANIFAYKSQGASTITQQLLRNAFDLREKTFSRKILELSLACKMESAVAKDDILELYLNHASFGGSALGAQKASRAYFNTDVRDLSVAQSAVLAALLQRPTYFSPYGPHRKTKVSGDLLRSIRRSEITRVRQIPDSAIEPGLIGTSVTGGGNTFYLAGRADTVLTAMLQDGYVDRNAHDQATKDLQTMKFTRSPYPVDTPYFPFLVQREMESIDGIGDRCRFLASGCTVTSTLDLNLQRVAEEIVRTHAPDILEKFHARNTALVAVDRRTRQIVAYVGNVDYSDDASGSKMDMALVPRQPGSSFKPFVYATAFLKGFTPASFLMDESIMVGPLRPQNYAGGFLGWTSIRHALAASLNIPAIRTFFLVGGEEPILELASRAGITLPLENWTERRELSKWYSFGYPLAIGSAEVPLLQMVQGYTTIANNGEYLPITSIKEVHDGSDSLVYESRNRTPTEAMPPLVARQITSILSDGYFRPTKLWDKLLTLDGIDVAAKTGTSNQCASVNANGTCTSRLPTDVWTLGYTPEYVVGVWVGNATYEPLTPDADGLNVASPLWKEFLQSAHAMKPNAIARFPASFTFDKRAKTGFYQPPKEKEPMLTSYSP